MKVIGMRGFSTRNEPQPFTPEMWEMEALFLPVSVC
jgi:hypothetical protein